MALATKPNTLETSDFSEGWVASVEDVSQPDAGLRDVLNLLPQRDVLALLTRKGFARVALSPTFPSTHKLLQVMAYDPAAEVRWLVCILSDGSANANNVQVFGVNINTATATRIDTAGRIWAHPLGRHWGFAVGRKWYGGSKDEPMYSWRPPTSGVGAGTWDPDAAVSPDYKTWVDAVNDGVTLATEYPRDYAWNGKEKVVYSSKAFKPRKSIRYEKWDTEVSWYSVGTRVSRKAVWAATNSYWKSFKCIRGHNPDTANRPGDGTGSWRAYWKVVKFGAPLDFHDNRGRPIMALFSFGQYLLVFKRHQVWILSGASEDTFNVRQLDTDYGTWSGNAVTELGGMVYYADEEGLFVTDGTQSEPVPGMGKIRDYWVSRIAKVLQDQFTNSRDILSCWSWGGYVWVSLPVPGDSEPFVTLVYYPQTASWWKLDLPVYDTAVMANQKEHKIFFTEGALAPVNPLLMMYGDVDTDDTAASSPATQDIAWKAATAWWAFGTLHEQRRIRRMWAIVKGTMTFTIKAFRDW